MSMPLSVESSEKWFIELWNYTILPYLNDILKMKLILNGSVNSSGNGGGSTGESCSPSGSSVTRQQHDPVEWIISNYPWPRSSATGAIPISQRLLRLKLYDNFLAAYSARSSSSDESEPQANTVMEQINNEPHQHLVERPIYLLTFIPR